MVTDNTQWHQWRAWHPIFVPDVSQKGQGTWVWMNNVFRRWRTEGLEQLGYWQYCLDEFQMIRLQDLEQQAAKRVNTWTAWASVSLPSSYMAQIYGGVLSANVITSSNAVNTSSVTILNTSICQPKNPTQQV